MKNLDLRDLTIKSIDNFNKNPQQALTFKGHTVTFDQSRPYFAVPSLGIEALLPLDIAKDFWVKMQESIPSVCPQNMADLNRYVSTLESSGQEDFLVTKLDLGYNLITTNDGISDVLDRIGHLLTHFSLRSQLTLTNLTFPGNNQLRQLDLFGCTGLTDTSVNNLLQTSPHLEIVFLAGCSQLTNLTFPGNNQLRQLDLSGCTGLTDDVLNSLKKTLPSTCTITNPDEGMCYGTRTELTSNPKESPVPSPQSSLIEPLVSAAPSTGRKV